MLFFFFFQLLMLNGGVVLYNKQWVGQPHSLASPEMAVPVNTKKGRL